MTTISNGTTTITPQVVDGYEAKSDSATIVHRLLDGTIGISLALDAPRSGDLRCYFATEAAAWTAHNALAEPSVWTLSDTDVPSVGMVFVRQGAMSIALDDDLRYTWLLTVGFQELSA
jgi:hypothetical protein